MRIPDNLHKDIQNRLKNNSFRALSQDGFNCDFYSNDYLGYSANHDILDNQKTIISKYQIDRLGSTGSRLISGNHILFQVMEDKAKRCLNAEAALFFNSGYDANIGLLSAVLKPKDIIFYDELCHASIRDGLQMSKAKSYKFQHNNYQDLAQKIEIQRKRLQPQTIYIITESVFSMDGDRSDIGKLVEISKGHQTFLIIDEAHALGVCGKDFKGPSFEYAEDVFARIYTCGKALGSHGGFVLGSKGLKDYLVNFSRPFIYTTGASPYHAAQVIAALDYFENEDKEKQELQKIISIFREMVYSNQLQDKVSTNASAIQHISCSGNSETKALAESLQQKGLGVKAILSPTVPEGKERIRVCLHSFNIQEDIEQLFLMLKSA
jgi:8-amino-7-oxononanoate synthase